MKRRAILLAAIPLALALLLSGCTEPRIQLTISASPPSFTKAAEQITFTYHVINTGNTRLDSLHFSDPQGVTCPRQTFYPDYTVDCTYVYTVTQADVQNGGFTHGNTAVGDYALCCGRDIVTSTAEIKIPFRAQLSLALSIRGNPDSFRQAGEKINYTYTVRNTGNGNISDPILIEDSLMQVDCPATGPLAPGGNVMCTATYTSTAADVTAGMIQNTAVAVAGVVRSEDVTLEIPLEAQPALSLEAQSNLPFYINVGDTIAFTYTLTNEGNVPLSGPFQITANELDSWDCPTAATLTPGESLVCDGTYEITAQFYGRTLTQIALATGEYDNQPVPSPQVSLVIKFNAPTLNAPLIDCSQFTIITYCQDHSAQCTWLPSPEERCVNK
jgi:hypothetical protein